MASYKRLQNVNPFSDPLEYSDIETDVFELQQLNRNTTRWRDTDSNDYFACEQPVSVTMRTRKVTFLIILFAFFFLLSGALYFYFSYKYNEIEGKLSLGKNSTLDTY